MSHTPGPWKLLPLANKYYGSRVSIGGTIVEVWSNKSWNPSPREEQDPEVRDSGHFENEVDYADACLIAAAPELLEALEILVGDSERHRVMNANTMVEKARAAIKKAKGQ